MALLVLIAGGVGLGRDLFSTARNLGSLREQRESLAAEVERLQTELAVEKATRLELERQAAELNAQVAELDGQVKFLLAGRARAKSAD